MEINVKLNKDLAKLPEMESISKDLAHKKHLGTMKHLYRAGDSRLIKAIMEDAIKNFREEVQAVEAEAKAAEAKALAKAAPKATEEAPKVPEATPKAPEKAAV